MDSLRFGFVKSSVDVHTLGIYTVASLLEDCRYFVKVGGAEISKAIDQIDDPESFAVLKHWVLENKINAIGFSYRLDVNQAFAQFEKLIKKIDQDPIIGVYGSSKIVRISFAGLPRACQLVKNSYGNRFVLFQGDETPIETLLNLGISKSSLPNWLKAQEMYDSQRWQFASDLISKAEYFKERPLAYKEKIDSASDSILHRLELTKRLEPGSVLTRAHVGPYSLDRQNSISEFQQWLKELSSGNQLDIVSIGSSQLTQERFGQDWGQAPNGGGVPLNSEEEFIAVKKAAVGMLVRSYSATQNIPWYAEMLERTIDNAWHALSIWWFNKSDGRGPISVRECLRQHVETLQVIARANKPFEPNVSHHFSFRGADDLTGIVSTFLALKVAKGAGVKTIILQAMLNTPKVTSGIGDIIKFRSLLNLARSLESSEFKVILQPRAGLSYFSPDLNKAKTQLATVSAMMTDIESNDSSPPIVHVVSYSEAVEIANPQVINESVQITRAAIKSYRKDKIGWELLRSSHVQLNLEVDKLVQDAKKMIQHMERMLPNLYSADGLYSAYLMGYFPVPQLWESRDELVKAVSWKTKLVNGGMKVVDDSGVQLTVEERLLKVEQLQKEFC